MIKVKDTKFEVKDIKLGFLFKKYLYNVKLFVIIKLNVSDEEAEGIAKDIILKAFESLKESMTFNSTNALNNYIIRIARSSVFDLIRNITGINSSSFNFTEDAILDWSALNNLFSNDTDKKINWTIKYLTMIDDEEFALLKDLNDAV